MRSDIQVIPSFLTTQAVTVKADPDTVRNIM